MNKKFVVMILSVMAFYVEAAEVVVTTTPAAPVENVHKTRDSLFRACKNEADLKQLAGDASNTFVANCVKNRPVK